MESQTPDSIKYTLTSTPASYGVEWRHGSGNRYQLVNLKGMMTLIFGAMPDGHDRWITTTVVDPSRFMDRPPATVKEFLSVVKRYVEE